MSYGLGKFIGLQVFILSFLIKIVQIVSLCIQSKCGKIRTRKNSVSGHFSRSAPPKKTAKNKKTYNPLYDYKTYIYRKTIISIWSEAILFIFNAFKPVFSDWIHSHRSSFMPTSSMILMVKPFIKTQLWKGIPKEWYITENYYYISGKLIPRWFVVTIMFMAIKLVVTIYGSDVTENRIIGFLISLNNYFIKI